MKCKKKDILKGNGTFNHQADKVKEPLFLEQDFFDPYDLLQVKYEMLRKVEREGWSVSKAAKTFGLTRPSYYTAFSNYQSSGLAGLSPQKRGPKQPHKLSSSVVEFIHLVLSEDQLTKPKDLVDQVQKKFGISIHQRSIGRIINTKKKL